MFNSELYKNIVDNVLFWLSEKPELQQDFYLNNFSEDRLGKLAKNMSSNGYNDSYDTMNLVSFLASLKIQKNDEDREQFMYQILKHWYNHPAIKNLIENNSKNLPENDEVVTSEIVKSIIEEWYKTEFKMSNYQEAYQFIPQKLIDRFCELTDKLAIWLNGAAKHWMKTNEELLSFSAFMGSEADNNEFKGMKWIVDNVRPGCNPSFVGLALNVFHISGSIVDFIPWSQSKYELVPTTSKKQREDTVKFLTDMSNTTKENEWKESPSLVRVFHEPSDEWYGRNIESTRKLIKIANKLDKQSFFELSDQVHIVLSTLLKVSQSFS